MEQEQPADSVTAAALARLSVVDAEAASDAQVALDWLVGSAGLAALNQLALQEFCWYDLPFKWLVAPGVRAEIVEALARFLDLAGFGRYAALCRSATTARVLATWADDPDAGFRAFRAAVEASGVEPPPLDDARDGWAWGSAMDPHEHRAFWSTAMALELAIEGGALVPLAPGWRARQHRIAGDHLRRPRPELLGESLLQAATSTRLTAWVEGPSEKGSGGARRQLVAPLVNALLQPVEPPRSGRTVAPVRWLLDQVEGGEIVLTQRGNLPRALVRHAVEQHPSWWGAATAAAPRSDAEVPALVAIWHLARQLRLTRRSGRSVHLTRRGAALRDDAPGLWSEIAAELGGRGDFEGAVTELLWAVLLQEPLVAMADLRAEIAVALTETGWQRGPTGSPVAGPVLARAIDEIVLTTGALGAIRRRGRAGARQLRLTPTGRLLGLALLRRRALVAN